MSEYRFSKPSNNDDIEAYYDLLDSAFPEEDVRGITKRLIEHHPEMTAEDIFMVKHGEEAVAGLLLIPQRWVIDGVEVRVAEMGCVGTRPEYRNRRLQWILNDEFDKYAKRKGYDICVLAGIPFFYRQFGYQYAVELDYLTTIPVHLISSMVTRLESKSFTEGDIEEAGILLRKVQEGYNVHSVRTHEVWQMQQDTITYGGDPYTGISLYNERRVVGYFRYSLEKQDKVLMVKELAVHPEYIKELASLIRRLAEENGLENVKTKLGHLDVFSQYLKQCGAEFNKPYGWQIKILNLVGFLGKLIPVFNSRLADSRFSGFTDTLYMNFWKYMVEVKIVDGKIEEIRKVEGRKNRTLGFNPYAFIQLVFGYRSRQELELAYPDFWVRGGYEELIDTMFPRRPGYIHYCY